jgi:hypothetical protein
MHTVPSPDGTGEGFAYSSMGSSGEKVHWGFNAAKSGFCLAKGVIGK